MTAFGDLKVAVEAIRGKAFEYLTKPFDLPSALALVQRAVERHGGDIVKPDNGLADQLQRDLMLGSSPAMQKVYKEVAFAAQSNQPVLIQGEPGTGKSLVAMMVHRMSGRASEPFLFFRPDANRSTESDSELFGTRMPSLEPGEDGLQGPPCQPGLLALAGKGSLVIEEFTELSISTQARVLSAIETGSYQALLSAKRERSQARLLFTTSQDLIGEGMEDEVLEALLSQLRVCCIQLPPLRDRREDIRTLVQAFLAIASPERSQSLSDEALRWLERREWPGNVRELKQFIQHAAVHCNGPVIDVRNFSGIETTEEEESASEGARQELADATRRWLKVKLKKDPTDARYVAANEVGFLHDQCLEVVEHALIRAMLEYYQGNRAAVAARLGLHRTTLRQKMKRYGL